MISLCEILYFILGAWQQTHEHLPSNRRYSYQPLATSISTTDLTQNWTLKTKARSLDNLYQTNNSLHPIIHNRFPSSIILNSSIEEDVDDDDNEPVLQTRF